MRKQSRITFPQYSCLNGHPLVTSSSSKREKEEPPLHASDASICDPHYRVKTPSVPKSCRRPSSPENQHRTPFVIPVSAGHVFPPEETERKRLAIESLYLASRLASAFIPQKVRPEGTERVRVHTIGLRNRAWPTYARVCAPDEFSRSRPGPSANSH